MKWIMEVEISEGIQETLGSIEATWSEVFPNKPFTYTFLEDDYNEQFKADQKRGTIFLFFSLLVILIACLGIVGLASFTVEQRIDVDVCRNRFVCRSDHPGLNQCQCYQSRPDKSRRIPENRIAGVFQTAGLTAFRSLTYFFK